jgi:hypothetical protein
MSKPSAKLLQMLEEMDRLYGNPKPPAPPKPEAEILEWPKPIDCPSNLQMALDRAQEEFLRKRAELEAKAYSTSCHIGPGDSDWGDR